MSVSVAQLSKFQFNWNNAPIVGGLLFTYAAGTTTKLTTYQDSFGAVPNTNPIVLDANGQCNLYLTDGLSYKFVVSPPGDTDPPTNPYWTQDNILSAAGAAGGISASIVPEGPFESGTDFTPGTTTTLTLSQAYGQPVNVTVHFDGIYQAYDQYSISGDQIIFNSPIPVGTNTVYIVGGVIIGSGSITPDQLASEISPTGASLVGFLQAGTGAVGETLQTVLSRFVSVRDFGAVGDGVTDDRPAIELAINALSGGGDLHFPPGNYLCNSYSSNTSLAGAQFQVLPIFSNMNFRFDAGAQITVGAFFNNQKFRLFSGYNATTTGGLTQVSNVAFYGGVIDFAGATNHMPSSYLAPRDGIDFAYCSVARVYGTIFQNGAISNAITAGTYTLGDDFIARDCEFNNLVQSDAAQTDHTSIYSAASNSHVIDCNFHLSSVQGGRVAACVELHAPYSSWKGGVVTGYCRGAFTAVIAAEQPNVTDHLYEGIDYNGRNALVFTNIDTSTNTLANLTIQNNRITCTQYTGDSSSFNLQQGILSDGLGLGTTTGVMVQGNTVNYTNTVIAGSDTLLQCASSWTGVTIQNNKARQCESGITVIGAGVNTTDWAIKGNNFLTAFSATSSKFINIQGVNVNQFVCRDNTFNFSGSTFDTPIFIDNSGTCTYSDIRGNTFPTGLPSTKDFYPTGPFLGTTNNAQYCVYNASMVFPAMSASLVSGCHVTGLGANDVRSGANYVWKGAIPSAVALANGGSYTAAGSAWFVVANISGASYAGATVGGTIAVSL